MNVRTLIGIGIVVCGLVTPNHARAWGDTGHRIICQIAFRALQPTAQNTVLDLLVLDNRFSRFSDACTYPDHPRKRATEHYVNLSRNAGGFGDSPCPQADKCVVTALMKDLQTLALSEDVQQRLEALKFLGHWVGDLHQPLHVSFRDDRGGNAINERGPCRRDLHAVWDTCIIERLLGTNVNAIADDLLHRIEAAQRMMWTEAEITTQTVINWADEPFQIAIRPKYCHQRQGVCWYQSTNKRLDMDEDPKKVVVDHAYLDQHISTVRVRLQMAGIRLAQILNQALDGVVSGPTEWPAERRDQAEPLFATGERSLAGEDNWSGAHWNHETQSLWLCRNGHEFRAYRRESDRWLLQARIEIDADFEAITQADLARDVVFLLAEDEQEIHQYHVADDVADVMQRWDISDVVADDDGMEGMTFIPDAFLTNGFVDADGRPYPQSQFHLGGIFLLSHQDTGAVYALDLREDGQHEVVGVYGTPLAETRGLEFDRSTGFLHAIDGVHYATLGLVSTVGQSMRMLDVIQHTLSPGPKGLEGLALPPADSGESWSVLTDDDNTGDRAVVRYNSFERTQ